MATHKEQLKEFLGWLQDKRREIADDYWTTSGATQFIYRQMLLKIQLEIWLTEHKLDSLKRNRGLLK